MDLSRLRDIIVVFNAKCADSAVSQADVTEVKHYDSPAQCASEREVLKRCI